MRRKRSRNLSGIGAIIQVFFMIIALGIGLGAGCRGCFADESQAVRALETQGYSDVKITDHHWIWVTLQGCGADAAKFDAMAINPAGKKVSVYVCVGWPFKGSTIRSD